MTVKLYRIYQTRAGRAGMPVVSLNANGMETNRALKLHTSDICSTINTGRNYAEVFLYLCMLQRPYVRLSQFCNALHSKWRTSARNLPLFTCSLATDDA